MKKYFLTLIVGLIGLSTFGQESNLILTYNMALPLGETSDYISKYSGRGFGIEWREHLSSAPISLGISSSWNVLYEETDDRYIDTSNGVVADGNQYRYMNIVPILGHINYYFNRDAVASPYIGIGIGTYYINQRTEFGQWAIVEDNWHFGFSPEVGVVADINPNVDFVLSIRYNYALESGDTSINNSYLGINLGFVY